MTPADLGRLPGGTAAGGSDDPGCRRAGFRAITNALAGQSNDSIGQPTTAGQSPEVRAVELRRRVKMTCAVDLVPQKVEWLWSGRVPLGMITMFAGDPKLGKSYVTLAMATALSRGLPLPMSDRPDRPGSTILMSAEDDPARTIGRG